MPQDNCTDYIRVSINVPNAYLPQITSITKHKQSNLHRINGYIKFNVTAREAAQQSLSVVLKVYEGDRPIEKIVIESKRRFFVYDIYPYTGGARRDYFIVSLKHGYSTFLSSPNIQTVFPTRRLPVSPLQTV